MKTYEEFELSLQQIERFKKQNAKSKIKRYIKKYGIAPEDQEQFYTYTQKQYDAYKKLMYANYVSDELVDEDSSTVPIIPQKTGEYNSDYTEIIYDDGLIQLYLIDGVLDFSKNGFYRESGSNIYGQDKANITSIKIGNGVTNVINVNFETHSNNGTSKSEIEKIIVSSGNKNIDSRNNCNAIIDTKTNKLICGCKNTIIPIGVTSIGDYAFSYVDISNISLVDGITDIGDYAFQYTYSSSSEPLNIQLPSSVVNIGVGVFQYSELQSIQLPNMLINIGDYAFRSSGLESIKIPESVVNVGIDVFVDCLSLKSVQTSIVGEGMFRKGNRYKEAEKMNITINSGCTSIGEEAFKSVRMDPITLPSGVTTINSYAFLGTIFTSITIPDTVTLIGDWALFGSDSTMSGRGWSFSINYRGTKTQWRNIIKGNRWLECSYTGQYISIYCTDGIIRLTVNGEEDYS